MEDDIVIVNKNDLKPYHKCEHQPYEYFKYELEKSFYNSKMRVSIYEIPPYKSNYPYHYHLKNEEGFYVINGKGCLTTYNSKIKIKKGDIILCPPMKKGGHLIENISDKESLEYLEFDVSDYPDVIFYPKSNKIGIIEDMEEKFFFDKESTVDYYKNE
ncbi:cupin domain-containing protein [Clostridium felsineum]|uniref:cupin domain-containing protein n=1 Tax=Clostridium felsineum TaxID=36839 RepID=UPI0009D10636|nr:cupin domain-containing protein [Clostridium felsineum]URZ18163.1 hypothetical protein CLFE_042180 [Clostridium felsineum DSM 794]